VNEPSHPNRPHAALATATAPSPVRALARWFALFAALCVFAHGSTPRLLAQGPVGGGPVGSGPVGSGLARIVAEDARKLLTHADAGVRGEAALVVAGAGQRDALVQLQQLANDGAPAARQRALLALGLQPDAGTVLRLDECLRSTSDRAEQDAVVAAFALGASPNGLAHAAQVRLFNAIVQSSWKRQRDTLLATLLGMATSQQVLDPVPLRRLYDDGSNRDPEVRALLLHLLLLHESPKATARATWLRRVLTRDSEAEREVAMRHLADELRPEDDELVRQVAWTASHDTTMALRALALRALARWRHPQAVATADQAMGGEDPAAAGEALRALLACASPDALAALSQRVQAEARPKVKAALLTNFLAPLPATLRDQCAQLAADTAGPAALRSAAVLALARAEPARAETLLRDVFRSCDGADQVALAQAMASTGAPVPLDRLLPHGIDLRLDPTRWIALLRAGHPEAERQVLQHLQDRDASSETLRITLRVWRRAHGLDVPRWRAGGVPSALLRLLGD
jgi:HEAT repeat protein